MAERNEMEEAFEPVVESEQAGEDLEAEVHRSNRTYFLCRSRYREAAQVVH